jgi:phosphodiesterase/alkaline phosphatase D-like protein
VRGRPELKLVAAALLSLALTGGAGAGTVAAPTAITGPVGAVGAKTATVTGTINPGGQSTTWFVEYGTSTSYGSKTGTLSAGTGSGNVNVASALSALKPGVTYHYRIVATNAAGTSRGGDAAFTTHAEPSVKTGGASEIGPSHATVAGSVDPNGLETGWYVEYGRGTSYGSRTETRSAGAGGSPVTASARIEGLAAGVTYHYRVVATNEAGTARGADAAFRTDPAPSVQTRGPQSVKSTSAVLVAAVNPGGRPTAVWFDYGTTTSYGARTETRTVEGSKWLTVRIGLGGLRPGTLYYVRAVARSDAGTVAGGGVSFRTSPAPIVTTGGATAIGPTGATLTGSASPNGRATSWWFEYGPTNRYGARTPSRNAGAGTAAVSVAEAIGGLQPATEYHFRLVAQNSGGRSYGADSAFRTASPPRALTGAVTGLSTTAATIAGVVNPAGVDTSWYVDYGATTQYGLRTAAQPAGAGTADLAVTARLTGLAPGVRFHYRVVAVSAAGTTVGDNRSFATAAQPRTAEGRTVRCTIIGTVGPDTLRGTPGRDIICGLGGDDVISAGSGADAVYGGAGADRISGGAGADTLEGGVHADVLSGGAGADRLAGMGGADELFGAPGADRLFGGSGRDVLIGGAGRDRIWAGYGRDLVYSRDGRRDVVHGGGGRDSGVFDRGRDRMLSFERIR